MCSIEKDLKYESSTMVSWEVGFGVVSSAGFESSNLMLATSNLVVYHSYSGEAYSLLLSLTIRVSNDFPR